MSGLIFDIQGHSVHDGTGCRTLVFLSGCPLRCTWCANPEGQLLRPRVLYRKTKCVHKHYRCVGACPNDAILVGDGESSPLRLDRAICNRCDSMECVKACLHQALQITGRAYTVDDLMRILIRDQGFWGSQGGVTFSGGEPLLQAQFLLAVLKECRASYMHTTVETSAHINTDVLTQILHWVDWMFIDIKHMDTVAHRAATGAGNELILHNIGEAAPSAGDCRLIIRVPIVPAFNDTVDNLQATAEFMVRHKLKEVNLLPFHRLGQTKYDQLDLDFEHADVPSPSRDALRAHQAIFAAAGLQCYVGSDTPF